MPPRRRAAGRRPSGGRVLDRGSAQQSETPIRGRGQGHRGARIRGGQRQRSLHDIPVESSNQSSPAISTSSQLSGSNPSVFGESFGPKIFNPINLK